MEFLYCAVIDIDTNVIISAGIIQHYYFKIWAKITNQTYCGLEIIYKRIFQTLNLPKITLLYCLQGVCIKC